MTLEADDDRKKVSYRSYSLPQLDRGRSRYQHPNTGISPAVGRLAFPGFFLDPNLVGSEPWGESWTGPQAGPHHHDRVLSVNGEPVSSSQEVMKLARARGNSAKVLLEERQCPSVGS
jgi:hypothetical protein